MAQKNKIITLIYVGRVILVGGKIGHQYLKEPTMQEMNFASKLRPTAIGWRIEAEQTDTGVAGPYTVLDQIEDDDLIDQWYNRDKAISDEMRIRKQSNKDKKTAYDEHIEVLRKMVKDQHPTHRRIFMMRIIYDIMNY